MQRYSLLAEIIDLLGCILEGSITLPNTLHLCRLRPTLCVKDLPQCSHTNGFSPVCCLIWLRKLLFWLNRLSHTSHLKGNSLVCLRWCLWSPLREGKCFPHSIQVIACSPLWFTRMWLESVRRPVKTYKDETIHSRYITSSYAYAYGSKTISQYNKRIEHD